MFESFLFGPRVGVVRMDVFVNRANAEDAVALLAEMRGSGHVPMSDDSLDGSSVGDPCGVGARPINALRPLLSGRTDRWSDTALALLLATVLGFGSARLFYLRPWGRGAALAIAQLAVLASIGDSLHRFAVLLGIMRISDVFGVLRRIWSAPAGENINAGSDVPS